MHKKMSEKNLAPNFALTLLRRLFLLAARHSVLAPSALAPQRRFCILNSISQDA